MKSRHGGLGALRRLAGITLVWLASAAAGRADDLINIDFTADPVSSKKGPAAYGLTATDFWNTYERKFSGGGFASSGTVPDLRLADGTVTAASMSIENAPGAWGNGTADPMYASYLYPFNTDPIFVRFTNLPAGFYDFYLYGHGGPGIDHANSIFSVTSGDMSYGSKATTTGSGWSSPVWQEGEQYVRFEAVEVGAGNPVLVQIAKGDYNEAYLSGIQLVRRDASVPLRILPNGGSFTNSVRVTLVSSVPAGEIRYTLDGAEPTLGSTRYQTPFELTQTGTVKARLYVNAFPASDVVTATFTADPGIRMTPAGGRFTNRLDVLLSTRITGAKVHYTLDGSDPTAQSPAYTDPLRLTAATTVRARAILNNFPVTEILTGLFQRVYAFDDEGISPEWRTRYFGADYAVDPQAAADADPDKDGTPNRQEFAAGTDPLDPLSGFFVGVRAIPELRFASKPGTTYRILRRTSLDSAESTVVAELRATGDELKWVDADAGVVANPAFYLVQPVP